MARHFSRHKKIRHCTLSMVPISVSAIYHQPSHRTSSSYIQSMWRISYAILTLYALNRVLFVSSFAILHSQKYQDNQLPTTLKSSVDDSESVNNVGKNNKEKDGAQMYSSPQSPPKYSMGAPIGSENVGNMLFDEEILKSGRGDIRVGSIGRWKDFKGNEIVRDWNHKMK